MKKTKNCKIVNASGLHARAAAVFVKLAKQFPADIEVRKDKLRVNGKSILGVLMLAAEHGSVIEVIAKGDKAEDAIQQLGQLIEAGFYE